MAGLLPVDYGKQSCHDSDHCLPQPAESEPPLKSFRSSTWWHWIPPVIVTRDAFQTLPPVPDVVVGSLGSVCCHFLAPVRSSITGRC